MDRIFQLLNFKVYFRNQYTQLISIVFMNLMILMMLRLFFFFRYLDYFADLSSYELFLSFLFGFRVDIITIFTFLGIFILILSLPIQIVLNVRFKLCISILWSIVFISIMALCIGDILYFEFTQRHVSNELLAIFNDMNIILDMAFNSLLPYTIISFILFTVIFYLNIKLFTAFLVDNEINKKSYLYLFLVILILFLGIRNSIQGKSFGIADAYAVPKVSSGTLALNGFFSFYRTLGVYKGGERKKLMSYKEALPIARELLKSDKMLFTSNEYPLQRILENNEEKKKYNVLIVLLESWGAEHIDGFTKYTELNVTPYFKKISNESLKFTNFYANGYRSIYGITSIYTGITLPSGFQYLGNGLELTHLTYLGQIAKTNGYSTIAMQSSNRRSYRIDAVSKLAGFDQFYGAEDMPNVENVEEGRTPETGTYDYNMFDMMHKKLNTIQEPFLSFMFTSTNHSDFHLPHSKFEKYPHGLKDYYGYLNSLVYVDNAIERFMESVKKEPWFDNTIFIFTSDHGHSNALNTIGKNLRPNDISLESIEHFRIPLIMYAPKIFEPKIINLLGSQNDIMPTIIDLLGFKQAFSVMGNSLFDTTIKNRFVYTFAGDQIGYVKDDCFIMHNYKLVVDTNCNKNKIIEMEKELKSLDTVEVHLLDENKWAE